MLRAEKTKNVVGKRKVSNKKIQDGGCEKTWETSSINTIQLLDELIATFQTGAQCDIPIIVAFQHWSFTGDPTNNERLKEYIRIAKEFPIVYKISIYHNVTKKHTPVHNDISVDELIALFIQLEKADKQLYEDDYSQRLVKYNLDKEKCESDKAEIQRLNRLWYHLSKKQETSCYFDTPKKYSSNFCKIEIKSDAYAKLNNNVGTKNTYSLYSIKRDVRLYQEFMKYFRIDPDHRLIGIIAVTHGASGFYFDKRAY
jgi:hypothetical protein